MTGFLPTSSVYPPIWQFDIPATTPRLQWEPPTTPSYRRQKHKRLSVSGLFSNLIGWLEASDTERSLSTPPTTASNDTAVADGRFVNTQAIEAQAMVPEAVHVQDMHIPKGNLAGGLGWASDRPRHLESVYAGFQRAISGFDHTDNEGLLRMTVLFSRSLRRKLRHHYFAKHLDAASLDPLDTATTNLISSQDTVDQMTAIIRRTLLLRLEAIYKARPGCYVDHSFWLCFAQKVCSSKGRPHDILLFLDLMRIMPATLKAQIPSRQIVEFGQAVAWHLAAYRSLHSRWFVQVDRFIRALQSLTADQRMTLDDEMRWLLLQRDGALEVRQRLRFSWLAIKAGDSHASTSTFIDAYKSLMPLGVRLSSLQLWHLASARLAAVGALGTVQTRTLVEAKYASSSERWTKLVFALLAPERQDEGLKELCTLLTGIGEFETLTLELTRTKVRSKDVAAIEAIAVACEDHSRALAVYDAVRAQSEPVRASIAWQWTSWAKYAERIIKDPATDTWRIWEVLGLTRFRAGSVKPDIAAQELNAKLDLLNRMSKWYLEANHLSERQTLRELQRVIYYQRRLSGNLTPQTLACVTELVIRDLAAGRRGRKTRLQWLIKLVGQAQGHDEAAKVADALRGWKWTLRRRRRLGVKIKACRGSREGIDPDGEDPNLLMGNLVYNE
ncbi:hypothetical protein HIM_02516 [Hirsutella minnesotensis 3608]|nr:hypothetical protein HIM_02516 [Hirsutella minnesotensis 3608]